MTIYLTQWKWIEFSGYLDRYFTVIFSLYRPMVGYLKLSYNCALQHPSKFTTD